VSRSLAFLLLIGTAILAVASAFHPMLDGDASAQLRTIAATPGWRAIHIAMLAGSVFVMTGLWVRLTFDQPSTPVDRLLVGVLTVLSIGIAINALDMAFMVGAGARMAARFAAGDSTMPAIYDVTHPIGRVAARLGNIIVAVAALVLGFVEWTAPRSTLRAILAWLAAAGGIIGVAFFDDDSRLILAAVALLSGWQLAVALKALRDPGPAR
jgi:hypothetical protein